MGIVFHYAARTLGKIILSQTQRHVVLHRAAINAMRGPFIIAATHIGHVEPAIVSCLVDRRIDWITRLEFYGHPLAAWGLRRLETICVKRDGVPVSTIRTAIDRLRRGRLVGIFPEGGV